MVLVPSASAFLGVALIGVNGWIGAGAELYWAPFRSSGRSVMERAASNANVEAPAHRRHQLFDTEVARLPVWTPSVAESEHFSGASQVWVQLWAGVGSSVMAALATTPFDVVKTRMQVSHGRASVPSGCVLPAGLSGVDKTVLRACCILNPEAGLVCVGAGAQGIHTPSTPDLRAAVQRAKAYNTMVTIARTEGMPALWRGTGSNIASCIPSVGLYLSLIHI